MSWTVEVCNVRTGGNVLSAVLAYMYLLNLQTGLPVAITPEQTAASYVLM
jgi:hypothetical protein